MGTFRAVIGPEAASPELPTPFFRRNLTLTLPILASNERSAFPHYRVSLDSLNLELLCFSLPVSLSLPLPPSLPLLFFPPLPIVPRRGQVPRIGLPFRVNTAYHLVVRERRGLSLSLPKE